MARGYNPPVVDFCETVAWRAEEAAPESAQGFHGTLTGKTLHDAQNGAVQRCSSSLVSEHGHEKGTAKSSHPAKETISDSALEPVAKDASYTARQSSENAAPKLSIAPTPSRLSMSVPPVNFGAVEKYSIYRSGYPKPENYSFLASLGLKTILTLVPEPLSQEYTDFIHSNGIRHVQIHIPANKDGIVNITPQRMSMALGVVLDRKHHPLLIHCNRGKHRTGCVTACFRKVNNVDNEDAISEYRDYSYPKCREDDMTFIRSFEPTELLSYAQSHGWPVTPPPEPTDEMWVTKKDSFIFSLEDIAAFKLPEEPDQSL